MPETGRITELTIVCSCSAPDIFLDTDLEYERGDPNPKSAGAVRCQNCGAAQLWLVHLSDVDELFAKNGLDRTQTPTTKKEKECPILDRLQDLC